VTLRGTWSAPANLLVAGEYAVTREGGLGIAVATAPRGTARLFERTDPGASGIRVVARMTPGETVIWPEAPVPLVGPVVDTVSSESPDLSGHLASPLSDAPSESRWTIELDTTSFFDATSGAKKGLGSSAVATLLLVAALRRVGGVPGPETIDDTTARLAVKAHRTAHNGRGSGYDICTSAAGGTILFVGGARPRQERLSLFGEWNRLGIGVYTWSGRGPVSSSAAVARFDRYAPTGSDKETEIIRWNNETITAIRGSRSWATLFRGFQKIVRFGTDLGEEIGVTAALPFVSCHSDDGWIAKASGAGNERAVILARDDHRRPLPEGAVPVEIERDGLRWEGTRESDWDGIGP
jgi:phosphomevalonate kinase